MQVRLKSPKFNALLSTYHKLGTVLGGMSCLVMVFHKTMNFYFYEVLFFPPAD